MRWRTLSISSPHALPIVAWCEPLVVQVPLPLRPSGITPKTISTMQLEFGDIVLVYFPFTSQTASKKRPAIVISSREYNTTPPDVVIAAVTSQVRAKLGLGDVVVGDWNSAGLLKPPVLKP